jgi:lipoprotein NlpD
VPLKTYIVIGLLLLQACTGVKPVEWDPQSYTVKSGDTLYSIAWRYEMDFRDIAKWNGISTPFSIYPGQRLSMAADSSTGTVGHEEKPVIEAYQEPVVEPAVVVIEPLEDDASVVVKSLQRPESIVVRKGDTLYSIARYQNLKPVQLARWNALTRPYSIYPGQKLKLTPPKTSYQLAQKAKSKPRPDIKVKHATKAPAAISVVKTKLPKTVKGWRWPVKGKVVKTFNAKDTARKGIKIAGNRGQTVKAAAKGKVVYSGNGLISYGNLIIIKHSNAFLSAYAYNKKLLVKEGDQVKSGQAIARMGTVDKGRAQLHFEIRKNGKPVNPLIYLSPKRG